MDETCNACNEAESSPWLCGSYMSSCQSCAARAFAKSPQAKEALLGYPGPLQAAMRKVWTNQEQYRQGRIETFRWIKLIDEARASQKEKA